MPKTATSTRTLFENLGRGVKALADAQPVPFTYEAAAAFGKQIADMMKAGLKAANEGSETDKQIKTPNERARQGFARALHRKVAKLPPAAT